MYDDPDVRQAAWALYVSLHNLAAGHTLGMIPTAVDDNDVFVGDVDDVLWQLNRYHRVLDRVCPDLVQRVRDILACWTERPAVRLVELLPVTECLEDITGASLPPLLPPVQH